MDSLEAAEHLVDHNHRKHTMEYKGKLYEIPFFVADGAVDVKLHDLPFDMPNLTIAEQMTHYGEVLSIQNDSWKTLFKCIPNGVRILRMRIAKPIPSYVMVAGEMTLVTHRNQIPTCRHCGRRVHYTMKCSEYAKSLLANAQTQLNPNTEKDDNNDNDNQQRERIDNSSLISPVPSRSPSAARASGTATGTVAAADVAVAADAAAANVRMSTTTHAMDTSSSSGLPPPQPAYETEIVAEISDTELDEVAAMPTSKETGTRNSSPLVKPRNPTQENFKRPGSPGSKNNNNKRASRSKNRH